VGKRDYQPLSATHRLCSICRNVVPAKVICRGNAIYLLKNCPDTVRSEVSVSKFISRALYVVPKE